MRTPNDSNAALPITWIVHSIYIFYRLFRSSCMCMYRFHCIWHQTRCAHSLSVVRFPLYACYAFIVAYCRVVYRCLCLFTGVILEIVDRRHFLLAFLGAFIRPAYPEMNEEISVKRATIAGWWFCVQCVWMAHRLSHLGKMQSSDQWSLVHVPATSHNAKKHGGWKTKYAVILEFSQIKAVSVYNKTPRATTKSNSIDRWSIGTACVQCWLFVRLCALASIFSPTIFVLEVKRTSAIKYCEKQFTCYHSFRCEACSTRKRDLYGAHMRARAHHHRDSVTADENGRLCSARALFLTWNLWHHGQAWHSRSKGYIFASTSSVYVTNIIIIVAVYVDYSIPNVGRWADAAVRCFLFALRANIVCRARHTGENSGQQIHIIWPCTSVILAANILNI